MVYLIIMGSSVLFSFFVEVYDRSQQSSNTYYVSPQGNDSFAGLSASAAWKSLDRVNRKTFQPDEKILFESNGIWKGQLHPAGSGEKGNRIIIGSYGNGNRPVIDIGEIAGAAITLEGQSWWEIKGIEITSGALPTLGVRREGISVQAKGDDSFAGMTVRDCYIHDVWGQVGGAESSTMIEISGAAEEVLVENNIIKRCDKIGICINGKKSIIVRGDYLENLGGDGIIVHGVEHQDERTVKIAQS